MPEGEGRVAYYLPIDDEAAQSYTEKRYSAAETAEGEVSPNVHPRTARRCCLERARADPTRIGLRSPSGL